MISISAYAAALHAWPSSDCALMLTYSESTEPHPCMRSRHLLPCIVVPMVLGTPVVADARLGCCSVHRLALMASNGPIAGRI